uniref:Saposin B-type domain-containing protein n=1 Tax=Plectus sambesii TaxID=2011161 RepID=A0A914UIF9_9BILA
MKLSCVVLAIVFIALTVAEEHQENKKQKDDDAITCVVCQMTLHTIINKMESSPDTLNAMGQQMTGACNEMPDEDGRTTCRDLIGDHFPEVFHNLVQAPIMQPETMCKNIGICPP